MNRMKIGALRAFLEATAREMIDTAKIENPDRQVRSKEYKAKISGLTATQDGAVDVVFDVSRLDGSGNHYVNHISIPELAPKFKSVPRMSTIFESYRSSDIKVYCSCKDFQFRFVHWLNKEGDYNDIGNPAHERAKAEVPNVTNPKDNLGPFCKHLRVSVGVLGANSTDIYRMLKSSPLPPSPPSPKAMIKSGGTPILETMAASDIPKQIDENPDYTPEEKSEAKSAFNAVIEGVQPAVEIEKEITSSEPTEIEAKPENLSEQAPVIEKNIENSGSSSDMIDGIVNTNGQLDLGGIKKTIENS